MENKSFRIDKCENGFVVTINSKEPTAFAGPNALGFKASSKQYIASDWDHVIEILKDLVK